MTLYTSTSLPQALELPKSDAVRFFESKPYSDWVKQKEIESKNVIGIAERLNEVIRGCNAISKTIARSGR